MAGTGFFPVLRMSMAASGSLVFLQPCSAFFVLGLPVSLSVLDCSRLLMFGYFFVLVFGRSFVSVATSLRAGALLVSIVAPALTTFVRLRIPIGGAPRSPIPALRYPVPTAEILSPAVRAEYGRDTR